MATMARYDKTTKAKRDVPCPNLIKTYNSNMIGIDISDMLGHLYCRPMKSRR